MTNRKSLDQNIPGEGPEFESAFLQRRVRVSSNLAIAALHNDHDGAVTFATPRSKSSAVRPRLGDAASYYARSRRQSRGEIGAASRCRTRGHRRVALEIAISAKIASYDQPRHPE